MKLVSDRLRLKTSEIVYKSDSGVADFDFWLKIASHICILEIRIVFRYPGNDFRAEGWYSLGTLFELVPITTWSRPLGHSW